MPRARNIKPGFFKNENLVEIAYEYRLLFAGLWVLSDRAGRLEDRPKRIKMEIFPADNVDVDEGLDQLQSNGFVVRYQVDGKRYIQVRNFDKHQNPHKNEAASSIPPPEGHGTSTVQAPDEHSASTMQAPDEHDTAHADSLIPCSLIPEEKPLGPSDDAPRGKNRKAGEYTHEFEAAWADYPKRSGGNSKADAFKAWTARVRAGKSTVAMHAGVRRYAAFVREQGKEGTQWVKQAAVFFGPGLHFEEAWVEQKEITALDVEMTTDPDKRRDMARRLLAQEKARPIPDSMRESY